MEQQTTWRLNNLTSYSTDYDVYLNSCQRKPSLLFALLLKCEAKVARCVHCMLTRTSYCACLMKKEPDSQICYRGEKDYNPMTQTFLVQEGAWGNVQFPNTWLVSEQTHMMRS